MTGQATRADRDTIRRARHLHRTALATGGVPFRRRWNTLAGCWAPDPSLDPEVLAGAVTEALASPRAFVLKQGHRVNVVRAPLLGRETVIKTYRLDTAGMRFRYLARCSRARRAWACGRTLCALQVDTAEPLGFVEPYARGLSPVSHCLTAFYSAAEDAAVRIGRTYTCLSERERSLLRRGLAEAVLGLYRRGLYHRDTKASNLLIRPSSGATPFRFMWIDLECVRCGVRPGPHAILRNLAQLNGSLGPLLPPDERRRFFDAFAERIPWLRRPWVWRYVEQWSDRRLRRQYKLRIGA